MDGAVFAVKDGLLIPEKTFGKLSSNILSSVFDVSMARSLYVQSLFDNAYRYLDVNDEEKYNECYKKLRDILGVDDEDLTSLKIETIRRKRSRDKAREEYE